MVIPETYVDFRAVLYGNPKGIGIYDLSPRALLGFPTYIPHIPIGYPGLWKGATFSSPGQYRVNIGIVKHFLRYLRLSPSVGTLGNVAEESQDRPISRAVEAIVCPHF